MFPMIDIIDNVIIDKTSINLLLSKIIEKFISVHNIKKRSSRRINGNESLRPKKVIYLKVENN